MGVDFPHRLGLGGRALSVEMPPDLSETMPFPGVLLTPEHPDDIARYLRSVGLLAPESPILSITPAGQGNMNCTLRISLPSGNLILKQSRPWVHRFPQIAAPWQRARTEIDFYHFATHSRDLAPWLPAVLHSDRDHCLLVLEDLGSMSDYTDLYTGALLSHADASALARFLSRLHAVPPSAWGEPAPNTGALQQLNAEHIFRIPYRPDNGLQLDCIQAGLHHVAQEFVQSPPLTEACDRLCREAYLQNGPSRIHGDFFPGSLLRSPQGPVIIDFEFSAFGRPEFDVGIFAAHLHLSHQPTSLIHHFQQSYQAEAELEYEPELALQFTGAEILRRLLGYAQLPVSLTLEEKASLLRQAAAWILTSS